MSDPQVRDDPSELARQLAAPFSDDDVKWKAQAVKGDRALAVGYIDARSVFDRLDAVFGIDGWSDEYAAYGDKSVLCKLSCRVNGAWVTKSDVGGESEQQDESDRDKSAHSDALKRAAVKWGVGRFLYRLPKSWYPYDPVKKQFVERPKLPKSAQPKPVPVAAKAVPAEQPKTAKPPSNMPVDGAELLARLTAFDRELGMQGLCRAGALLAHVRQSGVNAGYGGDLTKWTGAAIPFAVDETKKFRATLTIIPPDPPPAEVTEEQVLDALHARSATWEESRGWVDSLFGDEFASPACLDQEQRRIVIEQSVKARSVKKPVKQGAAT